MARDHDVAGALVVGYGVAEGWCTENNAYLVEPSPRYHWTNPYVAMDSAAAVQDLENLQEHGFVGQ
jgi:hypothetical protein